MSNDSVMRPVERKQPGPLFGWPARRRIAQCQNSAEALLTRYFLVQSPWLSVYLHHLQASDEDRALHDHPWSFFSFLLTSGYWEHTPKGRFWRRRFSLLWRPAEWSHRLELARPCWTLVIRFARWRTWGFHMPTGWQDWRSYGRDFCE